MNTTEAVEFQQVGSGQFALLILGVLIFVFVPIAIALIWKKKKNEPISTILIGAATFLLFVLILEKPIQNVLIFPTAMGLPDHAVGRFVNARPLLLCLITALFPGVFEETGRLVAYKTVLRKRKNRETSISHGIGHGGFEVVFILGMTYVQYILYANMINAGTFQTVIDQLAAQVPEQISTGYELAATIANFSFMNLATSIVERISAVMYHVGASILVFYACRDKEKFFLYPLAILAHTALDFIAAMNIFNVIHLSTWGLEAIVFVFGVAVFFGAYFLLYRKDEIFEHGAK